MTGAHFSFTAALFFGLVVLAILLIAFPYKLLRTGSPVWPILCILGFALATMATTAIFRSNLKGAQFQASKYLIYPELLAATACLFIYLRFKESKAQIPVTIVVVLVMLQTYAGNFKFGKSGFERQTTRAELYDYYYPDKKRAKMIAENVCKEGIYCLQDER